MIKRLLRVSGDCVGAFAAFNLGKLASDLPIAAVEVVRDGRALRIDPEPAAALLRFRPSCKQTQAVRAHEWPKAPLAIHDATRKKTRFLDGTILVREIYPRHPLVPHRHGRLTSALVRCAAPSDQSLLLLRITACLP